MAKERLKSPRLRLFIALELPAVITDELVDLQRRLLAAADGELRAAPREQLHLTLAFLGHRYERDLTAVRGAIEALSLSSVPLRFAREPSPKPARRPRLYAATAEPTSALIELRAELVERLTASAGFEDERRPFWPHATLCRVKSGVKRHEPVNPLPKLQEDPRGEAAAVTLFRSDLGPQGATHTPLLVRRLPPST